MAFSRSFCPLAVFVSLTSLLYARLAQSSDAGPPGLRHTRLMSGDGTLPQITTLGKDWKSTPCDSTSLKPIWYDWDAYFCTQPDEPNSIGLRADFMNETLVGNPLSISQNDVSATLNLAIEQLAHLAQETGNALIPPDAGGLYSLLNFTGGDAAVQFLGLPCQGVMPEDDPQGRIAQPRYRDVVQALQALQGLLEFRNTWTKINVGTVAFSYVAVDPPGGQPDFWVNFGGLVIQSAGMPFQGIKDIFIDDLKCDGRKRV